MLLELHVRNLALIERADLEFYEGLTILSGETGAGKSILIDSINLALGAKAGKDIIRTGKEEAYIELLFSIDDESKREMIKKLGIAIENDGLIIISRKISQNRSIIKINDEASTIIKLKKLTSILIDIHGQHEHQNLLSISKHLDIVDMMGTAEIETLKEEIEENYKKYVQAVEELKEGADTYLREREIEILEHDIKEIEKANLKKGEEERLHLAYKKLKSVSKISEALGFAISYVENAQISEALSLVADISYLDKDILDMEKILTDLDSLSNEVLQNMQAYLEDLEYDEESFLKIQNRLNTIRRIQSKYAEDIDEIQRICEEKKKRLIFLKGFDERRAILQKEVMSLKSILTEACDKLTVLRKSSARKLEAEIIKHLKDLNFMDVRFEIDFKHLAHFTHSGTDQVEFLISTNIGEPLKPLKDVASGGELSRIMLALKTVLAYKDDVETLIFDEIDTGISGRTAQRVSEKLSLIARKRQVICITHLPQIAAMADFNYLIEKSSDGKSTKTDIRYIKDGDTIRELARLLGGTEITEAVYDTAREMKALANKLKLEV